jgi:uncharacterized BrkB/YihY/UPF0761 family membrane protein
MILNLVAPVLAPSSMANLVKLVRMAYRVPMGPNRHRTWVVLLVWVVQVVLVAPVLAVLAVTVVTVVRVP